MSKEKEIKGVQQNKNRDSTPSDIKRKPTTATNTPKLGKEERKSESNCRPASTSSTASTSSSHPPVQSSDTPKSSKDSNGKATSSKSNQATRTKEQRAPNDSMAAALAAMQMDPNTAALAASMMEQEKFMQEMMNLSQLPFPNNPFYFGAGASFPPPPPPIPKSTRGRSQSPTTNGRDRSISPASSIASNISQQQQQQPPLDFNLFMNNLMNYQMMSGGGQFTAPLPPPPLIPGLPPLPNDLTKLPVDILAALTSAAAQGTGLGTDPAVFSALAQLNSLSNNVAASSDQKPGKSKQPNPAKNPSTKTPQSNSSKIPSPTQAKTTSTKPSSSNTPKGPSSTSKKPSRSAEDEPFQGLDLSIKRPNERPNKDDSNNNNRPHKNKNH